MEAELSDWLSTETVEGVNRKAAGELFNNYDDVKVTVQDGKFIKLRGSEADVNRLELKLMEMMMSVDHGGVSDLCSSESAAVNGHAYISYQNSVEKTWKQQQQKQQDEEADHPSLRTPDHEHTATDNVADSSHDTVSSGKKRHTGSNVRQIEFTDEMDVEKYIYHYLLFKHANVLGELAAKHHSGIGLKRSGVDANGKIQYRLQVRAHTQKDLSAAFEAIVGMVVELIEGNITHQKVELYPKACFDKLSDEVNKNGILLWPSTCHVVGPASALDTAASAVTATMNEICARTSPPFTVSVAVPDDKDMFLFHILPVGLTVYVHQGMELWL